MTVSTCPCMGRGLQALAAAAQADAEWWRAEAGSWKEEAAACREDASRWKAEARPRTSRPRRCLCIFM